MKKEYESPKMEVFEFDVKDNMLGNTECSGYVPTDCFNLDVCGYDYPPCQEFMTSALL